MKAHARRAFNALKKINAPVIDHGDPNEQWGAHFVLVAELYREGDFRFADYYQEEFREHVDDDGKIVNAFGIRQDVIDILDRNGLFAEWHDPGTVCIYDC